MKAAGFKTRNHKKRQSIDPPKSAQKGIGRSECLFTPTPLIMELSLPHKRFPYKSLDIYTL